MSRGYRRYIVAAVGGLAAIALLFVGGSAELRCQNQQGYAADLAHSEDARRREIARLPDRALLPCLLEQAMSNPEAAHNREKEQRDLVAQEGMALWAFWMVAVALLQAIIAIVGIVYIKRTLGATNAATIVTNKILETERKPFLTLRPVEAEHIRWQPRTGKVGLLRGRRFQHEPVFCQIKSSGRSPAILIEICRRWAVVEGYESPPQINPMKPPTDEPHAVKRTDIPIGPDGIVIAAFSEGIRPGQSTGAICLYGYLRFTDIDRSKEYVSGFYFRARPDAVDRGLVTALPNNETETETYWYHREVKRESDQPSPHTSSAS